MITVGGTCSGGSRTARAALHRPPLPGQRAVREPPLRCTPIPRYATSARIAAATGRSRLPSDTPQTALASAALPAGPAATERDDARVQIGQVLQDLQPDRAVARDHAVVIEGVEEGQVLQTGIAAVLEGLPPALARHPLDAPAEPLDRPYLRRRRILGR